MAKEADAIPESAEEAGILACGDGISIAYRRRPGSAALPGIVFLPGFRSDMTGIKGAALDRFCAGRGQTFLRFDYRGHGASSGRFEDTTIGDWREDALAAFDRLTLGPQILVGSSMGGWIALLLALVRPGRIVGIAAIAPAVDFTEDLIWRRLDEAQREEMLAQGRLVVPSAYDPAGYPITLRLVEEGRRHLLLDRPIPLDLPIRLLHGMRDAEVPWQNSLRLAERLEAADVEIILVKAGDHRLSTEAHLARLTRIVDALSRSVQGDRSTPPDSSDSAA